jgi:predicted flap endonuclease-1-like 5' DNA nuclease
MAVDVAPEAAAPTTPLPVEPPPERIDLRLAEPQDLTHVSGIDRTLAERLVEGGVTFARLAAWTAGDVRVAAQALDIAPSRIAAEGWIEQAALLSGGRVSHFLAGKSLRVPLALLPPPLDIPLDVEPEPIVEAAAEPVATAAKSAAESEAIVVPAAANDDRPPRSEEASESGPPVAPAIWPAAAAKAAILRPLRKPAERGDKAFDDVAALVAQTVATARNVGGMADRPARPASAPAAARAEPGPATEALRPQPAAKPAPPAAARVSPRSPAVTAPAPNIAPQPPRQERPMARMRTRGADPEASIEIRAHASAPAEVDTAALARSLGEALTPKPASPPSASTGRPPAERASQIAATLRQPASSVAAAPVRRMVVIDEIDNKWPMPAIDAPKPASPLLAARTSGLFSRLVKVLRGDAAD